MKPGKDPFGGQCVLKICFDQQSRPPLNGLSDGLRFSSLLGGKIKPVRQQAIETVAPRRNRTRLRECVSGSR